MLESDNMAAQLAQIGVSQSHTTKNNGFADSLNERLHSGEENAQNRRIRLSTSFNPANNVQQNMTLQTASQNRLVDQPFEGI